MTDSRDGMAPLIVLASFSALGFIGCCGGGGGDDKEAQPQVPPPISTSTTTPANSPEHPQKTGSPPSPNPDFVPAPDITDPKPL